MAQSGFEDDRMPLTLDVLDPSPVEESPTDSTKDSSYFPPPARSSTLGLTAHGTPYYLNRAQKYSSYTFTAFTIAHITNTSLIPLLTRSIPASNPYLLLTRPYYQSWPLAEPLLVISPLLVHIISGVALRIHRRRVGLAHAGAETRGDRRRIAWPKLSGTSLLGYLAVPLVLGHAVLNRGVPQWVEGGSSGIGLDFVGHGIALNKAVGFAGYAVLVAVAGFHVVWGWGRWLDLTPHQVRQTGVEGKIKKKRRWWGLSGLSGAVVVAWAAGGIGIVARGGKVSGWVGKGYDELYKKVPLLRMWV